MSIQCFKDKAICFRIKKVKIIPTEDVESYKEIKEKEGYWHNLKRLKQKSLHVIFI